MHRQDLHAPRARQRPCKHIVRAVTAAVAQIQGPGLPAAVKLDDEVFGEQTVELDGGDQRIARHEVQPQSRGLRVHELFPAHELDRRAAVPALHALALARRRAVEPPHVVAHHARGAELRQQRAH